MCQPWEYVSQEYLFDTSEHLRLKLHYDQIWLKNADLEPLLPPKFQDSKGQGHIESTYRQKEDLQAEGPHFHLGSKFCLAEYGFLFISFADLSVSKAHHIT